MSLRNYRNLLHISLLSAAGLVYCGRISMYIRLLPLMSPDQGSLVPRLVLEGVILAAVALSLGVIHNLVLAWLSRHGVRRVGNHFPDFLRTTNGVVIGLLPFLLFVALYAANVRGIWNQAGFDALDLAALPPCVMYLSLFSNLCLSMEAGRGGLTETGA